MASLLSEASSNAGRLEAVVAADAAVAAELRNRLSASEERLDSERGARIEACGRLAAAEVGV